MDILNKLLLKDLQEIAKVMEIEVSVGQKKDELKKLISHSLEENNTELAYGILDTAPEGFGFLKETTLGKNIYMSASQIKRFKLRRGDQVLGEVRKPIGEEKNFATLLDMIDASEVREDDETYMNPIDRLFEALEKKYITHPI